MRASTFSFLSFLLWAVTASAAPVSDGFEEITIQHGKILGDDSKRIIRAVPMNQAPRIDGRLDDAFWRSTPFQSEFLQREPNEGIPASEKTAVALGYDRSNLYIAIRCHDSEPDKIIAREMRRDALVDDDDYFEIVLDTYHDHRSGFYFIMNPNGVRRDGMLGDEGRQYNPSWDGIWRCKSRITDEGWQLELAIPWKTLRFTEGRDVTWGINFARMIRRKNEHVYWQLIPRELGQTNIFRLSEAGNLHGLSDLSMGGNFELKPYVMGGIQNDGSTGNKNSSTQDAGLDAKIALTGNLSMDLTFNTDFAQVEADDEQVNLTRFSLYFPEKREFFLEGAEVFNFGGARGWHSSSSFNLFYSRRIGLHEGREQRILGGAKVVGKIGNFQTGILNMVTDETHITDDDSSYTVPATNYSVIRLKRDMGGRGAVGIMATSKNDLDNTHYNQSFGVDAYLPVSRHSSLSGYVASSYDKGENWSSRLFSADRNLAASLKAEYRSDTWAFSAEYCSIGDDFNPAVGFVQRLGFRRSQASASYSPRPESSWIRQFTYSVSGNHREDHAGQMLDQAASASWGVQFQNSSRLSLGFSRTREYMPFDWEVRTGFLIPVDTYDQWRYSASYRSDPSRRIAGSLSVSGGDYFTGDNLSFSGSGQITLIPQTRFELSYSHNTVELPQGTFNTNTYGLRSFYFFSTELYIKAYLQLNDDKLRYDGHEKTVANIMLRWIYSPGSNIYLVFNDGRFLLPGKDDIQNRALMLKATFFWRK